MRKFRLYKITHHDCPIAQREKLALSAGDREMIYRRLHSQKPVVEALILATCNRLEFYIFGEDHRRIKAILDEAIQMVAPFGLSVWRKYSRELRGKQVVRHLYEVAAGLDSQMVGESQILGQLKSAYAESARHKMSRFVFHRLFHRAFRVGKIIRNETQIACGAQSVALAAVEAACCYRPLKNASVLLIGAGRNSELISRYLVKHQVDRLVVANRRIQKARALCQQLGEGEAVGYGRLGVLLGHVDVVIASTASKQPIIAYKQFAENLRARKWPIYMIDIAVPRDIEPKIGRLKNVHLDNIDTLKQRVRANKQKRKAELAKAKELIGYQVDQFMHWYQSLDVHAVISKLTRHAMEVAQSHAERFGDDFGAENKEKLSAFAVSLMKKYMHQPIDYLKNPDDHHDGIDLLQVGQIIEKLFCPNDGSEHGD